LRSNFTGQVEEEGEAMTLETRILATLAEYPRDHFTPCGLAELMREDEAAVRVALCDLASQRRVHGREFNGKTIYWHKEGE
jgi:hypothetical protein